MDKVYAFEKNFLTIMIDDFKQLLMYKDKGYFDNVQYSLDFQAKAKATEKLKLSKTGTMMYYYWLAYKEPFPKTPDNTQQQRINEIWLAMNMPENVVPI
jgi:hypothetical protein